jgi:hypothetical protein
MGLVQLLLVRNPITTISCSLFCVLCLKKGTYHSSKFTSPTLISPSSDFRITNRSLSLCFEFGDNLSA